MGFLTGPKPTGIKVETFRINYLIRSPKVEKLGFEPVRFIGWGPLTIITVAKGLIT